MARRSPNAVARRNIGLINKLKEEFTRAFAEGRYNNALMITRKVQGITSDPAIRMDQALCLLRMGRYLEGLAVMRPLTTQAGTIKFNDLMAELYGATNNMNEARRYGSTALRLKDEAVADEACHPLTDETPPPFDGSDPSRNIIAYSLFGRSPRYCEVAIMNCVAAARLMPGWRCRFYCDVSVPADIRKRLIENGGEVKVLLEGERDGLHPLMWRFLVADDPHVSRYLLRDADSLISEREAAAVGAWLLSGKWFHLIRDWFSHCELLLAGLWGGCTGVIPDMGGEIRSFLQKGDYALSHVDQHFLRKRIWPTVRQSVLSHDSQFTFFNNEPLPVVEGADTVGIHHIGANFGSAAISGDHAAPDGTVVAWTIRDEFGHTICSYESIIAGNRWSAALPKAYADNLAGNRWSVVTG